MRNKQLGLLVIISFVVKAVIAFTVELNNDEVYYWTYAQQLQLNYFDHPPGIAILLRVSTFNLLFQSEFFLRLGSLICAAISTWLIYLIGKKVKNQRAGLIAALLFTASPYCSIIPGLLVLPDAPLLMFWLWSVLLMLKVIEPLQRMQKMRRRLLLLGVAIGCCIMCKVHGVYLWAGFFLYILFYQRKLLRDQFLFYSGFITVLIISPIIYWNVHNNFITYRYHSSRVSFFSAVHLDDFFREFVGEIIYNNPVSFAILVLAVLTVAGKQRFMQLASQRLLLLLSFPLIITVLFISIFRDTLPHWTGPAYATLIPLMAAYLAEKQAVLQQIKIPSVVKWALSFTIVLLIPAFIIVKWLPVNIGKKDPIHLGEGDPTLDMNGFKQFDVLFDSLYRHDLKADLVNEHPFLISDNWFPAAHIDYYIARSNKLPFIAIGDLPAIHHYAWLNLSRPLLSPGNDAYFITVSNYFNPPSPKLRAQFEQMSVPVLLTQHRGGVAVRNFIIYRLRGYKGNIPDNGVMKND
jgi:Dolichyl-phosphate-mannose-protein mannosyltransferase